MLAAAVLVVGTGVTASAATVTVDTDCVGRLDDPLGAVVTQPSVPVTFTASDFPTHVDSDAEWSFDIAFAESVAPTTNTGLPVA
ncbi:MAG TPA: hypothetical protein VFZ83_11500, partial [Acidimicrobiia bacterium]|nr:hypothetical protein [Acidimicrobiia bacterium]